MAPLEATQTSLDKLQWEGNLLETENRWLREEFSEKSCVLTLEVELQQSENEAVMLRDHIAKYEYLNAHWKRKLHVKAQSRTFQWN